MDSLMGCAERLVRGTAGRSKLCFFVAGGGSTAVSALASTPGASAVLSEGRTTYDRHSFLSACGVPDRDTAGRSFSYGGRTAAGMATRAALEQGLALASMDSDLRAMPGVVGIGCASVLVSNPRGSSSSSNSASANNNNNNNNENAPPSGPFGRGTVVAASADGWILTLAIQMNKPRSRFEEELVLGHLVLEAAERMGTPSPPETKAGLATAERNYETPAGDGITENWEWAPCLSPLSMDGPTSERSASGAEAVGPLRDHPTDVVEAAARRVVEGGEDAVVLLPLYAGAHPDRPSGIRALSLPVLPNGCLVFPGSFHPPHAGHLSLAGAAVRTLEALEPYAHPRRHNEKPVLFELSLTNADKPAIDPGEVVARVSAFLDLASGRERGSCAFPEQWGIVLTRAPLFGEKIRVLRKGVLDRLEGPGRSPRIRFVIGTDTLVRILDPKYYPGRSLEGRDASLEALGEEGAAFVVGGRLEQGKNQDAPRFVSGREELAGLGGSLARMFAVIDESDFRVDLSSSELRARKEAGE